MLNRYKSLTNSVVAIVNSGRTNERLRDSVASRKVQDSLVRVAKAASEHHFSAGTLSSASTRLKGDKFLITARRAWFGDVGLDDLTISGLQASRVIDEDELPPEVIWHRFIYKHTARRWVLLTQPASVMAISYAQSSLVPDAMTMAADQLGEVIVHDGQVPTQALTEYINAHQVLMIAGVGVLAWADESREALALTQTLTRWAEVMLRLFPNSTLAHTPPAILR